MPNFSNNPEASPPRQYTRLYFSGRYREPLIDPRDIPRGWDSKNELAPFAVDAIQAAIDGSFYREYRQETESPANETGETLLADHSLNTKLDLEVAA